ncbi:hypothetical protein AQUCO_00200194v1 [Aquilegia coerulea]|uniref:Secreted protein n=1 Tax=Aquilegia coerulea TaxID=218851 RepID=A0A2G5F217_AQUCA|nr:hypothetical protein AQUCO_00200194v1 [Aquilegia coerulea]
MFPTRSKKNSVTLLFFICLSCINSEFGACADLCFHQFVMLIFSPLFQGLNLFQLFTAMRPNIGGLLQALHWSKDWLIRRLMVLILSHYEIYEYF